MRTDIYLHIRQIHQGWKSYSNSQIVFFLISSKCLIFLLFHFHSWPTYGRVLRPGTFFFLFCRVSRKFDILTRKFDLVSLKFDIFTRKFDIGRIFELISRNFEILSRFIGLISRIFELISRNFEILSRNFEILCQIFELISRNFENKSNFRVNESKFQDTQQNKKIINIPGPNTLSYLPVQLRRLSIFRQLDILINHFWILLIFTINQRVAIYMFLFCPIGRAVIHQKGYCCPTCVIQDESHYFFFFLKYHYLMHACVKHVLEL